MEVTRIYFLFLNLNPLMAPVCRDFIKSLIKCHKSVATGIFLKECMDEMVLPKTFLPRRLRSFDGKPFSELDRTVLKKVIENNRFETKDLFKIKSKNLETLNRNVHGNDRKIILDYAYYLMRKEVDKLKNYHLHKLHSLISASDWSITCDVSNVVNLSSIEIDETTMKALNFGLSFFINNKTNPIHIDVAFAKLERYSRNLTEKDINISKGLVYSCLFDNLEPSFPKRFRIAVNKLKNNKDIHITKADKANSFVILDKIDYAEKIDNLLTDPDTYVCVPRNPLDKFNRDFNKSLRTLLVGNNNLINSFSARCATLPNLYGLIKTHKPNNPIRPIISSIGSATYKLSKFLVKILSPLVGSISDSHIKNNMDLIDKIQSRVPNYQYKLVSFDVQSLFTKVPINDLCLFLEPVLESRSDEFSLEPHIIVELIKLCVVDNYFGFNGKYFKQKFGLSMGNPLSPVLSNIYMEFFETRLLPTILRQDIVWFRYIDYVLCFWLNDLDIDRLSCS